jgi:DNA recombination protein RmuC
VWALLSVIKTEFGKFGDLLEKTQKKLQEASNTIEDATSKSRRIEQKLGKVQSVSGQSIAQKEAGALPLLHDE